MKKENDGGSSTETTQTPSNVSKQPRIYNKTKTQKLKLVNLLTNKPSYSNSLPVQRIRLLNRLIQGHKLTTFQARDEMGIMHPSGRVRELKNQGYDIITYLVRERDLNGVMHRRVGQYNYRGRKNKKKEGK